MMQQSVNLTSFKCTKREMVRHINEGQSHGTENPSRCSWRDTKGAKCSSVLEGWMKAKATYGTTCCSFISNVRQQPEKISLTGAVCQPTCQTFWILKTWKLKTDTEWVSQLDVRRLTERKKEIHWAQQSKQSDFLLFWISWKIQKNEDSPQVSNISHLNSGVLNCGLYFYFIILF